MLNFDIMYILISYVLYVVLNVKVEEINKFVLQNSKVTQSWVTLYEQKRTKWDSDMK